MKTGIVLTGLVLILNGLPLSSALAGDGVSQEQRCKVYYSSSEAPAQADADHNAWTYGRDRCWAYEREIGKTMNYDPGSSHCESKIVGNNVEMWTCSYDHIECCYTP
jgi:hypothetical protein